MQTQRGVAPEILGDFYRLEHLPAGEARVAAAEELLARGQAMGGFENEYWPRLALTEALLDVPRDPANLVHYAWLRRVYLAREEGFTPADNADVLWRLKWAQEQVVQTPQISVAQAEQSLDEYASVLQREGLALRGVHSERARLALMLDDEARTRAELDAWARGARDIGTDCEACERRDRARILLDLAGPGDAEAVLEELAPVVGGSVTCRDEPAGSLAWQALALVRLNRMDEAHDAVREGWARAAGRHDMAEAIGVYLEALVRMGAVDIAADRAISSLPLLAQLKDAHEQLQLSGAIGLALNAALERGLVDDTIRTPAGVEPTAGVAARVTAQARELASRFDARHGNDRASRKLAERLSTSTVPDQSPAVPLRVANLGDPRFASGGPAAADGVLRDALALDFTTFAGRALAAIESLDLVARPTLLAAWRIRRDRDLPALTLPEQWHQASRLDSSLASEATDDAERRRLLQSGVDAARRSGDQALVVRSEAELALLGVRGAEAVQVVREATQRIDDLGSPGRAASLFGQAAEVQEVPHVAVHLLDEGARRWVLDGDPGFSLVVRAQAAMMAMDIDPREAQRRVDELDDLIGDTTTGAPSPDNDGAHARDLARFILDGVRAQLALHRGDADAAVAVLRRRVAAARDMAPATRVDAHGQLMELLEAAEDWPGVQEQATAMARAAREARDATALTAAQVALGTALVRQNLFVDAVEVLEAAMAAVISPTASERQRAMMPAVAWPLGCALGETGEPASAAGAFARAATAFEALGQRDAVLVARMAAAEAAALADQVDLAADHYAVARGLARELGDVSAFIDATREGALARAARGEVDEALADLDACVPGALAMLLASGEDAGGANARLDGVRREVLRQKASVLGGAERFAEAVACSGAAYEGEEQGSLAWVYTGAQLARFLALAGNPDAAAALARAHVPALPDELEEMGWRVAATVAEALASAGRVEEANALWNELGPADE